MAALARADALAVRSKVSMSAATRESRCFKLLELVQMNLSFDPDDAVPERQVRAEFVLQPKVQFWPNGALSNMRGKLFHELVCVVQAIQHERRRARKNQLYGLEF